MEIIKSGIIKDKKERYFTCEYCCCEFVADNKDKQKDRNGSYVICPCCNSYISWECGKGNNSAQLKETYEKIDYIVNYLDIPLDCKYDKIFGEGLCKKFRMLAEEDFNWYNPDASYEDDVWAFYRACRDYMNRNFKELY